MLDLVDDEKRGASARDEVGEPIHDDGERWAARRFLGFWRRRRGCVAVEKRGRLSVAVVQARGQGHGFEVLDAVFLGEIDEVDRSEDVGVVDEAEVRAEVPQPREERGTGILERSNDDYRRPDECGTGLVRGVRTKGDTCGNIECNGGLARCRVSGYDGEFAHGDAVGPEPVGGLRDEELVRTEACGESARGGLQRRRGRESAPSEGLFDPVRRASGGALEGEPDARLIVDAERWDVWVAVHRTVEPLGRHRSAAAVRVAAAKGASDAAEVGLFLGRGYGWGRHSRHDRKEAIVHATDRCHSSDNQHRWTGRGI